MVTLRRRAMPDADFLRLPIARALIDYFIEHHRRFITLIDVDAVTPAPPLIALISPLSRATTSRHVMLIFS